jgi:hypothetical protein
MFDSVSQRSLVHKVGKPLIFAYQLKDALSDISTCPVFLPSQNSIVDDPIRKMTASPTGWHAQTGSRPRKKKTQDCVLNLFSSSLAPS